MHSDRARVFVWSADTWYESQQAQEGAKWLACNTAPKQKKAIAMVRRRNLSLVLGTEPSLALLTGCLKCAPAYNQQVPCFSQGWKRAE